MALSRRSFLKSAVVLGVAASGCALIEVPPRRYVLVHGGWQGAWCWDKVVPLLRANGHGVDAIDLPGHGRDVANAASATLQQYADRVVQAIDASPQPVVLVGHSSGGGPITVAAEARPDRVAAAVYLAAFLPRSGLPMGSISRSPENAGSLVPRAMIMSTDKRTVSLRKEAVKEALYADCSDADVAWAIERLGPEPLQPLGAPVNWTAGRFGRVRRIFVLTLQDRAFTPQAQRRMVAEISFERVLTMDTSHSPFLSRPEELVRHLTGV